MTYNVSSGMLNPTCADWIVSMWNSLHSYIADVESVPFRNLLEKYWSNKEVSINWKADLTGTKSQSKAS